MNAADSDGTTGSTVASSAKTTTICSLTEPRGISLLRNTGGHGVLLVAQVLLGAVEEHEEYFEEDPVVTRDEPLALFIRKRRSSAWRSSRA